MNNNSTIQTALATYNVDPSHSHIGFKVRHLGFSKVAGRFDEFSVTLTVDPDSLSTLEVTATINTDSVHTGDEKRDAHLRSADFFDIEKYPTMTFTSTGVSKHSGNSLALDGNLTINGITRPVTLQTEFLGEAKDPWGGERLAFDASTTINRKDFDLTWNQVLETGGLLVGDDITITLEVQFVKQS